MIRTLIRLPLVLAIALPLAWAGTLFLAQDPDDIIVRITSTGLCGSDLHLYSQ